MRIGPRRSSVSSCSSSSSPGSSPRGWSRERRGDAATRGRARGSARRRLVAPCRRVAGDRGGPGAAGSVPRDERRRFGFPDVAFVKSIEFPIYAIVVGLIGGSHPPGARRPRPAERGVSHRVLHQDRAGPARRVDQPRLDRAGRRAVDRPVDRPDHDRVPRDVVPGRRARHRPQAPRAPRGRRVHLRRIGGDRGGRGRGGQEGAAGLRGEPRHRVRAAVDLHPAVDRPAARTLAGRGRRLDRRQHRHDRGGDGRRDDRRG